jgi:hypothetical protein
MQIARSIWFAVALASLGAIYLVFENIGLDEGGQFILAEFALFAIAFMATLFSGRPGSVLLTGVGLGLLFATVLAVGSSGSCGEDAMVCFSPGEVFGFVLIAAGALYPGWACGVGVGSIIRRMSAGGSNR